MSSKQGMGKRVEAQATFDFTKVGRNFNRQWNELVNRATAVGKILVTIMPQGNRREDLEEFKALSAEYHEELSAIGEEQAELVCKILKNVPRSWLMADAPAEIDWSEVESLDYIQADRYAQLLKMIGEGKSHFASAEAKN